MVSKNITYKNFNDVKHHFAKVEDQILAQYIKMKIMYLHIELLAH